MPKPMKIAPDNYYDMVGSVEKDKKIKHSEVFGKGTGKPTGKKPTGKGTKKRVPKGSHRMPDGTIMKDSDMPKKNKKKQTKKKY
tara:strand:- start:347 stop:598 length:252 start_codon:yes stop_codon:yes gene_type:complete